jgi:hypothetical protein
MFAPRPDTVARLIAETPGAHLVATESPDGTLFETPWVPYGPGFEIPLSFEHGGDGPFDWKILVAVIEGRPQCIRFECSNAGAPVTAEALHRFPLSRMVEEATLMASRPVEQIPRTYRLWADIDEVRRERAEVATTYRRRPLAKRKTLTDEFLQEVADVYRQHVSTGKPSQAVARHFNYTQASARRVVREARQREFLGPARPGRGGEHHTEGGHDA